MMMMILLHNLEEVDLKQFDRDRGECECADSAVDGV
jgi:hypothetical protein